MRCRFALLRSENGLVTRDIGRFMYDELGRVTPVIEIPEAGHHAMLDQPLILLTALRTLLADWDHSEPRRRELDRYQPEAATIGALSRVPAMLPSDGASP